MRPFNLEKAKAGEPVCNGIGLRVHIIYFNKKSDYPIIGLIDKGGYEEIGTYTQDGIFNRDCKNRTEDNLYMLSTTIDINGYSLPEPLSIRPEIGERFWYVTFCEHTGRTNWAIWEGSYKDEFRFTHGLTHLTHEAADLHAKALLSFTKEKTKYK